ncbi:hypothetical protein RQP46_008145 [Phenoliferia psychrophenolica]
MLTLYLLENSRAIRVEWALRELGLAHETVVYARVNGKRAPPEMAQESGHSLGKSPALKDSDGDLFVVESSAILFHLQARYGTAAGVQLVPKTTDWKATNAMHAWIGFSEGALMVHVLPVTYVTWMMDGYPEAKQDLISKLYPNIQSDLKYLEVELVQNLARHGTTNGAGAFLVGATLTVADIMMAFSVEYILCNPMFEVEGEYPQVMAWLAGLEGRAAFKAACAVARYDFVLPSFVA